MELTAATAGATRATGGFLGTSRRRPQSVTMTCSVPLSSYVCIERLTLHLETNEDGRHGGLLVA
uniref:Uncharacterized protein n=1 Tax=Oryza barthii TaxID=65489 RepID=A0A0D3HIX2_9ORYZ